MTVITAGYLEGIHTLKDGSIKLVLTTQELIPETAGRLFAIRGKYLKLAMSSENISKESLESIEKQAIEEKKKPKTQSQILRNVFYRLWEREPENFDDFNSYYESKMEKVINFYKEKL